MSFTTLWENKWLAVRERDGYSYLHEKTRTGTVAILPYHFDPETAEIMVLARMEVCPAHSDTHELNCITGGVEHSHTEDEAAVGELLEEAGYLIEERDLVFLGSYFVSKQTDTVVHCYAVEIKDVEKRSEAKGDGSLLEKSATTTKWLKADVAGQITDIHFAFLYCRLLLSLACSKLEYHGLLQES